MPIPSSSPGLRALHTRQRTILGRLLRVVRRKTGARGFKGNPHEANRLAAQIEQTSNPQQASSMKPIAIVDSDDRDMDKIVAPVEGHHRDKWKLPSFKQRTWLKRWLSH